MRQQTKRDTQTRWNSTLPTAFYECQRHVRMSRACLLVTAPSTAGTRNSMAQRPFSDRRLWLLQHHARSLDALDTELSSSCLLESGRLSLICSTQLPKLNLLYTNDESHPTSGCDADPVMGVVPCGLVLVNVRRFTCGMSPM